MRTIHFITSMRKASGASTFCGGLCNALTAMGREQVIAVCASRLDEERYELDTRIRVVSIESVLASDEPFDCAQVHGIWELPIHHACVWLRNRGIPYVISPHGSLAPWAMGHHAWKKWIAWYLWFRRDMFRAAAIHVTAESEEGWLAKFGLGRNQPIVLAPLGTSLPSEVRVKGEGEQRCVNSTVHLQPSPSPKQQRTLLFVGRIYPVKALDNLIRAFALAIRQSNNPTIQQSDKFPWCLRLVGPDQAGHMSELMSLCDSLHLLYTKPGEETTTVHLQPSPSPKQVQFIGPKYDAELSAEYDACDALALVSHTENFGATVVDALAHGKPVITSTNTPWSIVQGKRTNNSTVQPSTFNLQPDACGWWVDNDPKILSKAIAELIALTNEQRGAMGANGKVLVARKYTWEAIANAMLDAYKGAVGKIG